MPKIFEQVQLPIVAYGIGELIDFTAFSTLYLRSKITDMENDTISFLHADGNTDTFSRSDIVLDFALAPEALTELTSTTQQPASGPANQEAYALFTINAPGADAYHDADGKLWVVQSKGHFQGVVWVTDDGAPPPGGNVYGPAPSGQTAVQNPPSGNQYVPPVSYPAPQNPPSESVSAGIVTHPYYPNQPAYPSYNQPGWGSYPPQTVVNNSAGGTIVINNYYREKRAVQAITTVSFIK